jgi:hypothetical protein
MWWLSLLIDRCECLACDVYKKENWRHFVVDVRRLLRRELGCIRSGLRRMACFCEHSDEHPDWVK